MFESHARRKPEAVALVEGSRSMSYREQLNECANALAERIRAAGARPETLVALLADQGFLRTIGVLAIHKAGAAYLPSRGRRERGLLSYGRSLMALRLIHEVNSAFGICLPVRVLFSEPTVAGLVREIDAVLDKRGEVTSYPALVPLRPGGTRGPFFLVAGGFGGEAELLVYARLALSPQKGAALRTARQGDR